MLKRELGPVQISQDPSPYHTKKDSPLSNCSHFILYPDKEDQSKKTRIKYDIKHLKSVPASWIIDCINTVNLISPPKEDK